MGACCLQIGMIGECKIWSGNGGGKQMADNDDGTAAAASLFDYVDRRFLKSMLPAGSHLSFPFSCLYLFAYSNY